MKTLTEKVQQYNELNSKHDYTYMYSDCGSTYRRGANEAEELRSLYQTMTQEEKDLVGLHNNHILKRKLSDGQFGIKIVGLPDTIEEASKYFN